MNSPSPKSPPSGSLTSRKLPLPPQAEPAAVPPVRGDGDVARGGAVAQAREVGDHAARKPLHVVVEDQGVLRDLPVPENGEGVPDGPATRADFNGDRRAQAGKLRAEAVPRKDLPVDGDFRRPVKGDEPDVERRRPLRHTHLIVVDKRTERRLDLRLRLKGDRLEAGLVVRLEPVEGKAQQLQGEISARGVLRQHADRAVLVHRDVGIPAVLCEDGPLADQVLPSS